MRREEGIFCDDSSRLEMMKRVFQGRMIPLLAVFFGVIIPQILFQLQGNSAWNHFLTVLYLCLLGLYLVIFIQYGVQYLDFKRKIR